MSIKIKILLFFTILAILHGGPGSGLSAPEGDRAATLYV